MANTFPGVYPPIPKPARLLLHSGLLFGLALLCSAAAALLAGDEGSLWWHAGSLGAAYFLLLLAGLLTRLGGRGVLGGLLVLGWLFLTGLTYGVFLEELLLFNTRLRVALFWDSPNILAAGLALTACAVAVLWTRLSPLTFLLVLPALFITGSRTALVATLLGFSVLWLLRPSRLRLTMLLLLGLAGGYGVYLSLTLPPAAASRNLLFGSDNLGHYAWSQRHAAQIRITPLETPPPAEGGVVQRVTVTSKGGTRNPPFLIQRLGIAEAGVPYVASVYLRADSPQELRLSSALPDSQVRCAVSSEWQRCVTPVVYGDGLGRLQLHLRTLRPGSSADFELWGVQLERADAPSEVEHTGQPALREFWQRSVMQRFSVGAWDEDAGFLARTQHREAAWQIFRAHPWAGVGLNGFAAASQRVTGSERPLLHAHNLLLHLLAETGILGFLAWALPFFGVLALAWRRHWRALLPLLLTLLLLNLFDVTFYANIVYYPYWLTLGLLLFTPAPLEPERV